MNLLIKISRFQLLFILFFSLVTFHSQSQVSDYADSGNGNHKDDILWLTWSGTDLADGIHENDQATFNLPLGGTLDATFSQVSVKYPIADPTPSDGEDPDGYLPADIKTWCGATLYTAYDLSGSTSEILFSDVSATTGMGNGENGQDIAFKITYNMVINGYTIPVDVVTGDPESTNSNFSESINIQTNTNNWELIENIRGTNYGLSGLGTNSVSITETESGTACSSNVNSGTNSSPVILSKGTTGVDTELSYDIPFPTGDGHEGVIFGLLLPFDQGDAPATYGVASHLQIKNASSGPGLVNDSELYLGSVKGDSDYHGNNPLFSANADGDNNDDNNDEDGLNMEGFPLSSINGGVFTIPASAITLNNSTGNSAKLHTWIDFDGNGTFDIDEYLMTNVSIGATNPDNDLNFTLPTDASMGESIIRFRLTSDNTLSANTPSGVAIDGEVEDFLISLPESSTIDFDGVDDYLDTTPFIDNWTQATLMGWIKIENASTGALPDLHSIAGQESIRIFITSARTPAFAVNTQAQVTATNNYPTNIQVQPDPLLNISLENDLWYHITGVFNSTDQTLKLYLNGELLETVTDSALNSALITQNFDGSPHVYSQREFTIGRYPTNTSPAGFGHFGGNIDEVRVFNSALTTDQIQRIVYQEIENNSGFVKGSIINKDIVDISTATKISWNNLQAYYPMTNVLSSRTLDASNYNRDATLHNITTIQPQTAPMPYETVADGDWTTEATWLHGDVWDIEDVANNKDWSIVQIHDKVTTSNSHTQLGMFIDDTKSLTVTGDNSITNSWYLQLDGTLDLADDSQLIQGMNSDLVTDDDGKILRRQEGNLNYYWYNYWSSPVGATQATTNTNTDFTLSMLNDGTTGSPIAFTPSNILHETGKVSGRWLYKFQNGRTYYDWEAITPSDAIEPGVGYTHKGTQNTTTGEQQYIFEGKPNNGTIILPADDVDGDSTNEHSNVSGMFNYTSTLIGNPYPSAIDARLFIKDNGPEVPDTLLGGEIISGTVYVWEQWSGTSHNLDAYEGGYGTINYASTAPAYQWNNPGLDVTGLAKTPTFYIPVGQGFFVEVIADSGDIEFNNDQRVFITESDGDADPTNNSVFFRSSDAQASSNSENQIGTIRLELNVSNGNNRNFVLAFSDDATDGYDYGYDALTIDPQQDDLNSFIGDDKMVIQTFAPITDDKVIDLVFNSTGTYNYTLEITELKNIPENQDVYLRDNLTNTYFDIRSGAYSFSSEVNSEDTERFDIVFQSGDTLSSEEFTNDNTIIFVNNTEDMLYVKGLSNQAKQLNIINMLGQTIKTFRNVSNQMLENGINISSLSTGMYVVSVQTENNQSVDKKVIIN